MRLLAAYFGIFLLCSISFSSIESVADDLNDDRSLLERKGFDDEHAWFELAPSRFAVGLRSAIDSFPSKSAIGSFHEFFLDWMVPYQTLGVFSVGGHFGSFPLKITTAAIRQPNYFNPISGFQARYQLKFFSNQFLVPTAALDWNYYRLKTVAPAKADTVDGSFLSISAGLMINLGWIDKASAREAFQSAGMTKAYLTLEAQSIDLNNSVASLNGTAYVIGVRTEFE